ncbi:MAG: glycosyltransferase [Synergistaceae bacterium]|nr:glycosyltransferase [Synergistaceae bacterium]
MEIDYDVAIRTVGNGGEKYQMLLNAIKKLSPPPKAVYVILPEEAQPPSEKLGYEKFVYAPKGMMTQRIAALKYCQAEYILFCDDDITFGEDFVKKLHRAVTELGYSFATGEILSLLPVSRGIKHLLPILHAAASPTIFHKDYYVTILRSSGWSYNRFTPKKDKVLPTQSAAGACFYVNREAFQALRLQDELWAQHDTLAPADDQIMFYKAHCMGLKVCVVTDAHLEHLDAKSAVKFEQAIKNKNYWSGFNRAVFWHRFIYLREKTFWGKMASCISFGYFVVFGHVYALARKILKPSVGKYSPLFTRGVIDGLRFTKSEEYKNLSRII